MPGPWCAMLTDEYGNYVSGWWFYCPAGCLAEDGSPYVCLNTADTRSGC